MLCLFLFGLLFPQNALAKIGVGVGTGKITIQEALKPGTIYELPPFVVLNTGDEPSDYEVAITYHDQQTQLRPPQEWFSFSPAEFHLKPGKAQVVAVKLNLPVKTAPGAYFAYLEGHPVKKVDTGGNTAISIAAAAKLYFSVAPANLVLGIYYRALAIGKIYGRIIKIITVVLALAVIFFLGRKFLKIEINFKKKDKETGNK